MTDWKAIADLLAAALRQCQVPADWPMAWPDGTSEGTPWVDEALAAYDAAQRDGAGADDCEPTQHPDYVSLDVARFCAIECELQQSGERSVWWMVDAWLHAMKGVTPTVGDVLVLGRLVEPFKNAEGFRQVGVRVGWDVKPDWQTVPGEMVNLMESQAKLTPAEFFRRYEEIHPFRDGNGRTGAILFNWLNNTLWAPVWPPNFWEDPRRKPSQGAPAVD